MACDVLLTPSKIYFDQVPLILAESNKSRAVLATKTMNRHLDQLWYGSVSMHGYSRIYLSFLVSRSFVVHRWMMEMSLFFYLDFHFVDFGLSNFPSSRPKSFNLSI